MLLSTKNRIGKLLRNSFILGVVCVRKYSEIIGQVFPSMVKERFIGTSVAAIQ
jgi:hypothetical protein